MDNKQFFEILKSKTPSKQEKMDVLQYYIDNFPIIIDIADPFNPFKKIKQPTKLEGVHIISGGNNEEKYINHGFMQLKKFITQMEEYVRITADTEG